MSFLSYMDVAVLSHPRGCSTWDGRVTSAVGVSTVSQNVSLTDYVLGVCLQAQFKLS